ncbi:MAG: hypothetical protein IJS71_09090 [Clostridia bacterium]|nr:hypothetical protein [Clostridia bacterium]
MIYIILALISLSVIYLARYFKQKGMRAASVAIVALFCAISIISLGVLFFKAVHPYYPAEEEMFILFSEKGLAGVFFGDRGTTPEFTFSILQAVVVLVAVTAGFTALVLIHGLFEITKAVVAFIKSSGHLTPKTNVIQTEPLVSFHTQKPILKLNCRMNC